MEQVSVKQLFDLNEEPVPSSLVVFHPTYGYRNQCPICSKTIVHQHSTMKTCVVFNCTLLHKRGRPTKFSNIFCELGLTLQWRPISNPTHIRARQIWVVASRSVERRKHARYPKPIDPYSELKVRKRGKRTAPTPMLVAPEPLLPSPHLNLQDKNDTLVNYIDPFMHELHFLCT